LVVELVRHHRPVEAFALAAALGAIALAARRLARDFVAHPANFPTSSPSQEVRLSVAGADGRRGRSRWASLNRTSDGG
jgi:hypothetical protein